MHTDFDLPPGLESENYSSLSLPSILSRPWVEHLYSFLVFYSFLGFALGSLRFGDEGGVLLVAPGKWVFAGVFAAALLFASWRGHCRVGAKLLRIRPFWALAGFVVYIASDAMQRAFGFYIDSGVRLQIFYIGLPVALLFLFSANQRGSDKAVENLFSWPYLAFFQVLITILFLQTLDGRLIFSDDHPSFLYRLYLLQQHFPRIPFYSPDWEAGYSAREFFASGILNVFFLSFPFWYSGIDLGNLVQGAMYNWIIPYVYIGIIPVSVYFAALIIRCDRPTSILAAVLALGPTAGFFEWLLKYGTLGFSCAMGLVPLAFSLSFRLALDNERPNWGHVAGLLIASYLCIAWSLSILVFVPIAVYSLFAYRTAFSTNRRLYVGVFALLFVLCNGPWMSVFVEESKVLSFVSKSEMPGVASSQEPKQVHSRTSDSGTVSTSKSLRENLNSELKLLRALFAKVNPLVLLFFLPGMFFLPNSRLARVLLCSIVFLLLCVVAGEILKPQLELRRMLIPAAFLSVFPVSCVVTHILKSSADQILGVYRAPTVLGKTVYSAVLVLTLGAVMLSPITVAAFYQNRSREHFKEAPDMLDSFVSAIQNYGGEGRVFFLGFILQDFGASDYRSQDGGHIALLAALSGKPMYAHYYYHSRWETIDPIPKSFRKSGSKGVEEFLDLLNVTSVVAFRREWIDYCRKSPSYQEVYRSGKFHVFTRRAPTDNYFLEGDGSIETLKDGFEVTAKTSRVVVKFRYLPKLKTNYSEHVELFSQWVFDEETGSNSVQAVRFVGLNIPSELIGKPIKVSYRPY